MASRLPARRRLGTGLLRPQVTGSPIVSPAAYLLSTFCHTQPSRIKPSCTGAKGHTYTHANEWGDAVILSLVTDSISLPLSLSLSISLRNVILTRKIMYNRKQERAPGCGRTERGTRLYLRPFSVSSISMRPRRARLFSFPVVYTVSIWKYVTPEVGAGGEEGDRGG